MNEMKKIYGQSMTKSAFFSEVNKLHDICRAIDDARDKTDFAHNAAYNLYVVNGVRRPENFGEMLRIGVNEAPVSGVVKRIYWANCWYRDERRGRCFEFPSASALWEQF